MKESKDNNHEHIEKNTTNDTEYNDTEYHPDRHDEFMKKLKFDYKFDKKDDRDYKYSDLLGVSIQDTLPPVVDLRQKFLPVFNQQDINSCVSNSVAACVRYIYNKEGHGIFNPSRLFIYYNGRKISNLPANQDTGLSMRNGYASVATYSVCSEETWPYITYKYPVLPSQNAYNEAKTHKSFQYLSLNQDLNQIRSCLASGFPVSFGATLYESFLSPIVAKTGIIPDPNIKLEKVIGGHGIFLCGYDDKQKYFIGQNSWSNTWGMNGAFMISYNYIMSQNCVDFWTPRVFQ